MAKLSEEEVSMLQNIMAAVQVAVGGLGGGSAFHGTTGAVTGVNYSALAIREDGTTFSALVCTNGTTTLGVSDFYKNGAASLKGDILRGPTGYVFKSFTITSGSVAGT